METFVIVGASLAGAKAAETLREEGFDGRLVLIGAESERPYSRPPLSKGYLRGETARERIYLHGEGFYAENEIELRTATRVASVEPSTSQVVLGGGERVGFDRLLLATGSRPRRLSVPGSDLDGVLYLREVEDSDAIRERLERGGRVAVVGAGWIGTEIAASARELGVDVTILDPMAVPLERVLGTEVGAFYRDLHADAGVELALRTGVAAFEGARAVERVVTTDRKRIDADVVVVGVGVTPRTELADAAGLVVDNGILVDEHLRTNSPHVFAAGDVASVRHPLYGRHVRVEHWATARHQGPAAARNMLGREAPYERIPYFFSDQYDVSMEYRGHPTEWDEIVFRGDPAGHEFLAFWLEERRVVAGMNVNVGEVGDAIEELIRSRKEVDRDRLGDSDTPLEEAIAEPVARNRKRARTPLAVVTSFFADGVNYTRRFVGDRITRPEAVAIEALANGEGRLVSVDGEKLAVYKDDAGEVFAVSPVCTHMRCLVEWKGAERTWDCPCHGSRFDHEGRVLEGPAKKDLERKQVSSRQGSGG